MLSEKPDPLLGPLAECMIERDMLREALEYIAGSFVPGDGRQTYGDPDETLDRIRDCARKALDA